MPTPSKVDPGPPCHGGRRWPKRIAALLLGTTGVLLTVEIVLRFLPVNDVSGLSIVNAADPTLRLTPDTCTTRSKGPALSLVTEVCTNNVGFRNDQDYVLDPESPLLALVGDSYVVAATVPFEETLGARMSEAVAGEGRVYSFGIRGAALPQYLAWANYAREQFHPDAFVFLVIANDFRGSMISRPGYHHFEQNADGTSKLALTDSTLGWRQRVASHSALMRYLFLNLQVHQVGLFGGQGRHYSFASTKSKFVGNIDARYAEASMERFRRAFQSFLDRLPEATGVPMERILFVMDGMRPHMYTAEDLAFAETSSWAILRRYTVESATERGIEVVDLHPRFVESFEENGERFETPEDSHWSGVGHAVAAQGAIESRVFQAAFGD